MSDQQFKHVLIATDFSNGADVALEFGLAIAAEHGARVTIAHAHGAAPASSSVELQRVSEARREWGQMKLDDHVASLKERGLEASGRLLSGPPATAIAAAADSEGTDLIVTGARGAGDDSIFIIGSVAEGIARSAAQSVLVVRGGPVQGRFDRILVATDLSDASAAALPMAMAVATPDADVEVMHVVDSGDQLGEARGPAASALGDLEKLWGAAVVQAEDQLDAMLRRAGHGTATLRCRVVAGVAARAIIAHLVAETHDLLIVGKRAAAPTSGSVAERLVRHANCHVLVARHAHSDH